MMQYELITNSPEETQALGRKLGELAQPGDIFLLNGQLGAGKTCLTQGIAWGLGIDEYASSPTFVIMREMHGRLPLYHMDIYRLDNVAESADLGMDDYLYGDGVSVVEWAEKAQPIFPKDKLQISLTRLSDTARHIKLEASGERYRTLIENLRH